MNPIFRAAAELSEGGTLLSITTIFFVAFFVSMFAWVMSRSREDIEEAARLPLSDDLPATTATASTSTSTPQRLDR